MSNLIFGCLHDDLNTVNRELDRGVDPSADDNRAIQVACRHGHLAIVERLLQDARVNPAAANNHALRWAAFKRHLTVINRLLQDERVDPSWCDNLIIKTAAANGHLAIVNRLLQDARVDPATDKHAILWAASNGHVAVVDRLLEDGRVDVAVAIQHTSPKDRKRFECRKRFTEICIAMQDLNLPAWITVKILKACKPWSTLELHQKWKLVCTVKHFHDKHE